MPGLTWPSGWVKCLSHRTHQWCLGACQPKNYSLWCETIPFSFKHIYIATSLLFFLTKAGKFHRPELAKCLLSVWPACILKHLKSENSAHLQELQTEGVLCGIKIFNYEEFKKTSKLKLQIASLYCFLSAKILKGDCMFLLFCEDFYTWLSLPVYQMLVLPPPCQCPH